MPDPMIGRVNTPEALSRVAAALQRPMVCFVRDDDAGWDDEALLALLDRMDIESMPMDVAVIPMALTPRLAATLRHRLDACPLTLGVHQHGYAHVNHAQQGRKTEFGDERHADSRLRDLCEGRARLMEAFGSRLDDIFTPPWNRVGATTPALLARAGLRVLSRERKASIQEELPEVSVDVDWSRAWREGGWQRVITVLACAMIERSADGLPLGLMLHHATMDAAQREALGVVLRALRAPGTVVACRMCDVHAARATSMPSSARRTNQAKPATEAAHTRTAPWLIERN